jgi:hypothetical protein
MEVEKMRDKGQTWTEQQERLLFAAQAVVNDAEAHGEGPGDVPYMVDRETLDALREVVKQISDDAVKALEEFGREARRRAADVIKLRELEAAFAQAGGRGVELAEQIDALRAKVAEGRS